MIILKDEMHEIVFGNRPKWFLWHENAPMKNVAWRWKMCWNKGLPQQPNHQNNQYNGLVTVQDYADITLTFDLFADTPYAGVCPYAFKTTGWGQQGLNIWNNNWKLINQRRVIHYGNSYNFLNVWTHYYQRYQHDPTLTWNSPWDTRKDKMDSLSMSKWVTKIERTNGTSAREQMMQIG